MADEQAQAKKGDGRTVSGSLQKLFPVYARLLESQAKLPVFLQRNVSYMKHRMSRPKNTRNDFKLDDILERMEPIKRRKISSVEGTKPQVSSTKPMLKIGRQGNTRRQAAPPPPPSVRVVFTLAHHEDSSSVSETREDLTCPICSIKCFELYSLLKHLKLSHPGLIFKCNNGQSEFTVSAFVINSYFDGFVDGGHLGRCAPTKGTTSSSIIVCHPKRGVKETVQDILIEEITGRMSIRLRGAREPPETPPVYPTKKPIEGWFKVKWERVLAEYVDVSDSEKQIMALWTFFMKDHNYMGDKKIPAACMHFVDLHGKEILEKKLYNNCVLHFYNLFQFRLLKREHMWEILELLYSKM